MRKRIYTLKYDVEFNARYWAAIESKIEQCQIRIRLVLIIGSLVSIGALIADTEYLKALAITSAFSGLVSTVILPAIGWENKVKNVNEVRCRWLDLEKQVNLLWADEESNKRVTQNRIDSCDQIHTEIAKMKVGCKFNETIANQVITDMIPHYPS